MNVPFNLATNHNYNTSQNSQTEDHIGKEYTEWARGVAPKTTIV